jgi:hypothetical protein
MCSFSHLFRIWSKNLSILLAILGGGKWMVLDDFGHKKNAAPQGGGVSA